MVSKDGAQEGQGHHVVTWARVGFFGVAKVFMWQSSDSNGFGVGSEILRTDSGRKYIESWSSEAWEKIGRLEMDMSGFQNVQMSGLGVPHSRSCPRKKGRTASRNRWRVDECGGVFHIWGLVKTWSLNTM